MGRRQSLVLVLGCAIALTATAPVASAAAPHHASTRKLNATFARTLARQTARHFEVQNQVIVQVNFEGCERGSPDKIHCAFYGRGTTRLFSRVCDITVLVQGTGTEAIATLKRRCKAIPRLLTFARAMPLLEAAAEELAPTRDALSAIRRVNPLEIMATATWIVSGTTTEECTATLLARLNTRDIINVPSWLQPCTVGARAGAAAP